MIIPEFFTSFPSEERMDTEQLAFYKKVESSLNNGEYIDIQGNVSYVFVYLYKLLSKWNQRGFDELSEFLIYISEIYKNEEPISSYCLFWAYDCLLGLERYEEFLEKTEPQRIFGCSTHYSNLRLNVQKKIGLEADHIDVLLMAGGRKTKFITSNQGLYKDKIKETFHSFIEKRGEWFGLFETMMSNSNIYSSSLFNGAALACEKPVLKFKTSCFYAAYDLIPQIKDLAKDAENIARKEIGVPQIGEGWISETTLFLKIESEFSATTVIQHGQPKWLGRQHFDIWLPHWKIAIEYHGKQHFEPVEFFGGEDSFKKTVERDKRKVDLALQNGVRLFVVTEQDDQDILVQKLYELIENRKILPPYADKSFHLTVSTQLY